jgi:hypothetical protein
MKWFFDESGITVVGKEKSVTLLRDHPQYTEIKKGLLKGEYNEETIYALLDPEVIKAREALLQ